MNPSTDSAADFEISHSFEYGLRLPTGEVVWPPGNWHGLSVDEPGARDQIITAINGSAINLGIDPEELVSRYGWAIRRVTRYSTVVRTEEGVHPLDDHGLGGIAPDNS